LTYAEKRTMKATPTTRERIGRVGQRRQVAIPRDKPSTSGPGTNVAFTEQKNGVLIKAKRTVDTDDTLTPQRRKSCSGAKPSSSAATRSPGALSKMRFRVELSCDAQNNQNKVERRPQLLSIVPAQHLTYFFLIVLFSQLERRLAAGVLDCWIRASCEQ
jgi:hypothetical protein